MSKALGQAAKLKPEIRLAQALSEFCAGLGESRSREFKSLRTTSPPTPDDVVRLTEEVNRDGSRTHKAWRPYATNMALFLEKVQRLARIGDFLVGSSQNLIASGVWTAVKLTLGIAVGSLRFFQRVSDLFLKIGKSSNITKDLVQVFPDSKELRDLMCEYLITLVGFCAKIAKALEKPAILQLTCPFIAFFDTEASQFEAELARWGTAIDRQVMVLLSRRQANSADAVAKIGRTLVQWVPSEEKKQHSIMIRSIRVQEKLHSRQPERVAAWRRQRKKGTTEWLFQEQAYQDWKSSTASTMLWIHGKLGSGKTVLLANVVAELYRLPQGGGNMKPIVTYHFCNHDHADSNTYDCIMGSIIQQILAYLEPESETVADMDLYLQRAACPSLHDEAISILRRTLPRDRSMFLILDALDECQGEVVAAILGALKSISEVCLVHLCCSTRTDAPVSRIVSSIFPRIEHQVSMSSPPMLAEMKGFVEAEFERRRHVRRLDVSLEEIVKDVLVGASEGMYLWVALQIETLFPLHGNTLLTDSDILRLLENPPKDLSEVFDRALERIADRRYGKTIFQLIAAARRPLTVAELRIALHVQPGILDWDPMNLPKDGEAIIALCGGCLLEVDEEDDTVRFIHQSVQQHLEVAAAPTRRDDADGASAYKFRISEADIYLGMVCVTYLRYSIFDTTMVATSKVLVDAGQLTKQVTRPAGTEASVVSTVITAIKRRRVSTQQEVDIGQILQRYLEPKVNVAELLVFSDYTHEHWIWHTARFWPAPCGEAYGIFRSLLHDPPEHVAARWPENYQGDWLFWAQDNHHFGIYLECILQGGHLDHNLAGLGKAFLETLELCGREGGQGPLDHEPQAVLKELAKLLLQRLQPPEMNGFQSLLHDLAGTPLLHRISSVVAVEEFERVYRDGDSVISLAATWGTRRRSLPSIMDVPVLIPSKGRWKFWSRPDANRELGMFLPGVPTTSTHTEEASMSDGGT